MTTHRKRTLQFLLGLLAIALVSILVFVLVPMNMEARLDTNQVLSHDPFEIGDEPRALHGSLTVADWHADTLLWLRDPLEPSEVGQVDIPRLAAGNVAVQVFTAVTRVPNGGINLQGNEAEGDRLMFLALGDNWPAKLRKSLFERAAYQASRLFDVQSRAPERVSLGSDYDGSVPMPFDVSELAILTQVMLDKGFRDDEIRAVMGGNIVRLLSERLPGR